MPKLGRRSAAFIAGSVLIDIDHAAEYAWWTGGRVSFPRGFGRFQDRLWEQVRRPEYLVLNPLHTLECFATVAFLGRSRPWLRALLLGMLFHRLLDLLHDSWHGVADKRAVSLLEYALRTRRMRSKWLDPGALMRAAAS
ncbi:MAG TPA: hypothetical protein VG370_04815 [Chloroflexota bacterium]|nr:hypothetical protein [Chloroflexota bacterium]